MKYYEIPPRTVFGELTVRKPICKYVGHIRKGYSECICSCGKIVTVLNASLRSGNTKSCGHTRIKKIKDRCITHGLGNKQNRIYRIWIAMKNRCNCPTYRYYSEYGGRGIKIHPDWLNSFESFYLWSIKNGYDESKTIDRIDNNKGYTPENCRWASWKKQQRNKRNNVVVSVNGYSYCIAEWAEKLGVTSGSLYAHSFRGHDMKTIITKIMEHKCLDHIN